MSKPPLSPDAVAMLERANPATVATLRSDGSPVSTATWYLWDDGRVLLNMDEGRARLKHLRRDPRVTLTVLDENSWYNHISLIGRVVELRDDKDLADIDRISTHYAGGPYPERERARVTAVMEIERWHGWGSFRDSDQATV
ncbi:PPOX class F420-dependent oxidoreductase [Streptomyces sp. WG-D5]